MRRAAVGLGIVVAVLLGAVAPAAWAQETVKIGLIQPLSGPVAASGNYVRMGAEIGRDWINGRGGVLGRQIQLLIEDNKSDPKEAATAAEKLIVRDKVPVIVGAWGSSMTLAAMPKLEEYGVPMVVETSSAASVTKRGNPWIFRISPPSEMEALGLEKYMKDLGIKQADFLAVFNRLIDSGVLERHDIGEPMYEVLQFLRESTGGVLGPNASSPGETSVSVPRSSASSTSSRQVSIRSVSRS